jgi:hypothetical protein
VVDASSADPGIENVIPIPLDYDHITICRPDSVDTQIYRSLKKFIGEWFSTQIPISKIASSQSST